MALKDQLEFRAFNDEACVVALRRNGADIDVAARDKLLAKLAAGEYVELEMEIRAFVQEPGKHNKNFVRVKDGRPLSSGAKTWATKPFLRDHERWNTLARGGTIISSELRDDGGAKAIYQTVRLTAPWAVEQALRKLMDRFSVSFAPTAPILCSVCDADARKCAHWPGDTTDDGQVVEVVFTGIEGVETSSVNDPAVEGTGVESIRAQLAAMRSCPTHSHSDERDNIMRQKLAEFLKAHGVNLSDNATDEEVLVGISSVSAKLAAERDKARDQSSEAQLRWLETLSAQRDAARADAQRCEKQLADARFSTLVEKLERRDGLKQNANGEKIPSARFNDLHEKFYDLGKSVEECEAWIASLDNRTGVGVKPQSAQADGTPTKQPEGTAPAVSLTAVEKSAAKQTGMTEAQFIAAKLRREGR